MKTALIVFAILIAFGVVLLQPVMACSFTNRTWTQVGEIVVPDAGGCTSGCRLETVQISWDTAAHNLEWEYVAGACTSCPNPAGGTPAQCVK